MPRRIVYSADEMAWLEANRLMIISDYHAAFVAAFGRDDVTAEHLHALRKRKGWKVGRAPGRHLGRGMKYGPAELTWLEQNVELLQLPDWHAGFVAAFGRDDVTPQMLVSLRKRRGWKTGRDGRFGSGHVPANKGKKMPYNAASAATQFKPGQVPVTAKPVGHERLTDDGYVLISIDQVNPWTGGPRTFVLKHLLLWEQAHGPVPDGMCLKCLGDKSNPDPSNWELVPRGVLPRLTRKRGFDQAPDELKPIIMTVARLEHAAANAGGMSTPRKVGRPRKEAAA